MLPMELGGEAGTIREMQGKYFSLIIPTYEALNIKLQCTNFLSLTDATQQELVDNFDWFQREDETIKTIAAKQPKPANKNIFETLF